MSRVAVLLVALLLVSTQSALACTSLYSWFDRVFGPRTLLYMPLGFELPDVLDDLSGYVVLGTEVVDNFRGCAYGRIVQFRSGDHVTCDDYGWDYASWGTEVVIVARPALSGKDTIGSCKAHCKMIVTDFFDNDVYDVSCADYAKSVRGLGFGSDVQVPEVDTGVPDPEPADEFDWDAWNAEFDERTGTPQNTSGDFDSDEDDGCPPGSFPDWAATMCQDAAALGIRSPSICDCQ